MHQYEWNKEPKKWFVIRKSAFQFTCDIVRFFLLFPLLCVVGEHWAKRATTTTTTTTKSVHRCAIRSIFSSLNWPMCAWCNQIKNQAKNTERSYTDRLGQSTKKCVQIKWWASIIAHWVIYNLTIVCIASVVQEENASPDWAKCLNIFALNAWYHWLSPIVWFTLKRKNIWRIICRLIRQQCQCFSA